MPMAPLCVNKKAAMRKRAHPRASVGSPLWASTAEYKRA